MGVGEKGRGKNKGNTGQRDWSSHLLWTLSGQSFSYINAPEYEKKKKNLSLSFYFYYYFFNIHLVGYTGS